MPPPCAVRVDHGVVSVGGNRQILEPGDARDRGEIDQVSPVGEVGDGVIAVTGGEHERVVARLARERVVVRAAVEHIGAFAAIQFVIASAAIEPVIAPVAFQGVVAATAMEDVVSLAAPDVVGAFAAVDKVVARPRLQHVVARAAPERIVALPAEQDVGAGAAREDVVPGAAVEPVAVIVGFEHVVSRGAAAVQERFRLNGAEPEVLCVQVSDCEALEQDRAAAVRAEMDGDPVLVRGDGQGGEVHYGGKRAEIDDVFPIREVGDDVVSVVGAEDEGIGARSAGERVVAGSSVVRGFVRDGAGSCQIAKSAP